MNWELETIIDCGETGLSGTTVRNEIRTEYKASANNSLRKHFGAQGEMKVYWTNPIVDSRWEALATTHEKSSIFHQVGWLKALASTYGYEARVLTSAAPGEILSNGLLVCRVASWMTGKRTVALPFADHCEPLLHDPEELGAFMQSLSGECQEFGDRYVELRPLSPFLRPIPEVVVSRNCWFHELDLAPSLGDIYHNLHKSCFRRKIDRAGKEQLSCETGNAPGLLDEFYRLLLLTRRRHRYLPQPKNWFKNLIQYLGAKLQISVARKDGMAIAAILSIRHHSTVVYKYGCSDSQYHRLGGMPLLFWKLIESSKNSGATKLDLGRSDLDNPGLVAFKDRLGAARRLLTYYRYTNPRVKKHPAFWQNERARNLFFHLPDLAFSGAGRALYRHMG